MPFNGKSLINDIMNYGFPLLKAYFIFNIVLIELICRSLSDPPGEASLRLTDGLFFAIKGTVVTLECQFSDAGNPTADSYVWTHNGRRIEPKADQMSSYRTGPSDVSTRGEYSCAAINFVGQGKWAHFWLEVKSKSQTSGFPLIERKLKYVLALN